MPRQDLNIGAMEKECFLACFPFHVWLHFLHSQAHQVQGWNYAGLGLPTSVGNQENVPQTCLQTNLMIAAPQLKSPLPKCVKLTAKVSHYFFIVFPFFTFLKIYSFLMQYIVITVSPLYSQLFPNSSPLQIYSPLPLNRKEQALKSKEQTWQNIM